MADIKAAYHALALDLHPDKQQNKEGQRITIPSELEGPHDQTQRFQLVQAAWQVGEWLNAMLRFFNARLFKFICMQLWLKFVFICEYGELYPPRRC